MSHEPIVQPSRNGQHAADVVKAPDPEVVPKAERRRFTTEYKLRILAEADACTQRGAIGALLRREGLYRSHLDKWRAQRRAGALQALAPVFVKRKRAHLFIENRPTWGHRVGGAIIEKEPI